MPTRRKLALASGGLGVAGLITGTVLGLVADSRYDEGLATCADTERA
jgi:hypothetical protein